MSTVFPIADQEKLLGSAVFVHKHQNTFLLATVLHLFGESEKIQVAIPPHEGNCSIQQPYPVNQTPTLEGNILVTDPFADLAIISVTLPNPANIPFPKIVKKPNQISVGSQITVLGYPFAPLGSVLETWTPGHVTALARRNIYSQTGIDEIVLSNQAHPGLSGSPVLGIDDGKLYGILRGSLAPPEVMKVGNVPIATDTSVTYATSAHYINDLIQDAIKKLDNNQ